MANFIHINCHRCKVAFGLDPQFYEVAKQRAEDMTWYCPNGHGNVFASQPTEADKLRKQVEEERRKRQIAEQRVAEWADSEAEQRRRAEFAERKTAAAKGQVTRLKNRARAGLCPCCNRSFVNLQRHMGTKHPGFMAEPDAADQVKH